MKTTLTALAVMMLLAGTAQAQGVANCAALGAMPATTVLPTALAAVSDELVVPRHELGAPSGVLAQAFDESLSVEHVLYRNKLAACATFASVTPVPAPGALPTPAPAAAGVPAATDPAAYVPRTEFDNTPWRFDMNQNGKRMTADEFTAWMEAKGVRVVKPRTQVASAMPGAAPVAGATAAPSQAAGTVQAELQAADSIPGQAPGSMPAVVPSPVTQPEAGADQPRP